MQIDAERIPVNKDAFLFARVFRMDRDVICRAELFIVGIIEIIRRVCFGLLAGGIHHLIQIPCMRCGLPRFMRIKIRCSPLQFLQQGLRCKLSTLHVPVAVQTIVQLFSGPGQRFVQINVVDILLRHMLFQPFDAARLCCRIARRHLAAVERVFVRCYGKVKSYPVFLAVFLHQLQHMCSRITLPRGKQVRSGIIFQSALVEQPAVPAQQNAAAVQILKKFSGELIVQRDHLMPEAEMICEIVGELVQHLRIELSVLIQQFRQFCQLFIADRFRFLPRHHYRRQHTDAHHCCCK